MSRNDPIAMVRQVRARGRWMRALAATFCVLAAGCVSHIDTLREAERTFSRAAEMENRERYGEPPVAGAVDSYTASYRLAAATLDRLIAKRSRELAADNLLCTAYTLHALSLWRLADRDGAVRQSRAGLAGPCAEGKPGGAQSALVQTPRDRALLRALPGLARIDEANERMAGDVLDKAPVVERITAYQRLKVGLLDAIKLLDDAERELSPEHPLRGYLALSRMGAVRVWQVAVTRLLFGESDREKERTNALEQGQAAWERYRRFLHCRFPGADRSVDQQEGLQRWRRALGVAKEGAAPEC